MKILSHGKQIESISYNLCFYVKGSKSMQAFSFECDENGKIFPIKYPEGQANYERALKGLDERNGNIYLQGVVETREHSYWQSAIGKCQCGEKIDLGDFTNTCGCCGRDYNSSGQELAPREQWGEETGEHWSECY